jgi:xanthine/CO dehydrogenase XdhC/CoxF family maturation factor
MWESMVEVAQNTALHWAVIAVAILAWILKVLTSGEGALMGDMYHDELDT